MKLVGFLVSINIQKENNLYPFGYDNSNQEYLCAKISSSIFNSIERLNFDNLNPVFFKYNKNNLIPIENDSKRKRIITESFRKYNIECSRQNFISYKAIFLLKYFYKIKLIHKSFLKTLKFYQNIIINLSRKL